MANENKHDPENKKVIKVIINKKEYEWTEQYITGAQVRQLANIAAEEELFLKTREPKNDEMIGPDTSVDLAKPGIEHFYSVSKVIILIVNGREKTWSEKTISFEQLINLAFGSIANNPNTVFTVTYKNGPEENRQGTMVKGDVVYVKNKMIFNVTATDKS